MKFFIGVLVGLFVFLWQPRFVLALSCVDISDLDVLVDKNNGLPQNYRPSDLVLVDGQRVRLMAAQQLEIMRAEMKKFGLGFKINSGYRAGFDQAKVLEKFSSRAALPGHSEHQLGTAVDLAITNKAWKWLDKNAHLFGFIMSYRYPQQFLTGYQFEPWHWRYVGVDLATKIRYSSDVPQKFYRKISC